MDLNRKMTTKSQKVTVSCVSYTFSNIISVGELQIQLQSDQSLQECLGPPSIISYQSLTLFLYSFLSPPSFLAFLEPL